MTERQRSDLKLLSFDALTVLRGPAGLKLIHVNSKQHVTSAEPEFGALAARNAWARGLIHMHAGRASCRHAASAHALNKPVVVDRGLP